MLDADWLGAPSHFLIKIEPKKFVKMAYFNIIPEVMTNPRCYVIPKLVHIITGTKLEVGIF